MTYLMQGAHPGWPATQKLFNNLVSTAVENLQPELRFLERVTLKDIMLIAVWTRICLSSNLILFMQCYIYHNIWIVPEANKSWTYLLQPVLHSEITDWKLEQSIEVLMRPANQFQICLAKLYSRKRCLVVSAALLQRLQIETTVQPLSQTFSLVGILLFKILCRINDLEGGMQLFQMILDQGTTCPGGLWYWKASLNESNPESEQDQTT